MPFLHKLCLSLVVSRPSQRLKTILPNEFPLRLSRNYFPRRVYGSGALFRG